MISNYKNLIKTIDNFKYLPHSILLVGDYGSGHNDVCEYIANKFNLIRNDITNNISLDTINEISQMTERSLYTIDMTNVDERKQNVLLKLFEEPNEYTYLILNCEYEDLILDTIKSRSYRLNFDALTKKQLSEYVYLTASNEEIDLILNVCTTIGQVEVANNTNIKDLYSLCNKILTSMSTANFQNSLSIANKINFKDEYSKFDLQLFLKVLKYQLLNNEIKNKLLICEDINKCSKYIGGMNNKQQYFENFLINMWLHSKLV